MIIACSKKKIFKSFVLSILCKYNLKTVNVIKVGPILGDLVMYWSNMDRTVTESAMSCTIFIIFADNEATANGRPAIRKVFSFYFSLSQFSLFMKSAIIGMKVDCL